MAISRYSITAWLGLVVLGVALYRCEGGSGTVQELTDLDGQVLPSAQSPATTRIVNGDGVVDATNETMRRVLVQLKTGLATIVGSVVLDGTAVEGATVSCSAIGVRVAKTFGRTNELGQFTLSVGPSFTYRLRAESGENRARLEPVTAGQNVQLELAPHHPARFQLVDTLGEAVVGVRVLFVHRNRIVAAPRSSLEIDSVVLPAGRISALVPGWKLTKGSSETEVSGSGAIWRIVVEAFGSCNLTGRVLSRGQPVKGALVSINQSQRSVRTDGDGRFSIQGLDQGRKCIWVDHPNFVLRGKWVQVTQSDGVSVVIELRKGRTLNVTCLANRIPVQGAAVRVVYSFQSADKPSGRPEFRVSYRDGITDDFGRVTIRGCWTAPVRIVAQHATHGSAQLNAVTYNDATLTLVPKRRFVLRLSSFDQHGSPQAWGATIAPARPIGGMSPEIMTSVRFDTKGIASSEVDASVELLGVQLRCAEGLWWSYSEVRVADTIVIQSPGTRLLVDGLTRKETVSFESDSNFRGKPHSYDHERRRAECWVVPGVRYTVTVQNGAEKVSRDILIPTGAKRYVVSWR